MTLLLNNRILTFLFVLVISFGFRNTSSVAQCQLEAKYGYGLSGVRETKAVKDYTGTYSSGNSFFVSLGYEAKHDQLLNLKFALRYIKSNMEIEGGYFVPEGSSYVRGDFVVHTLDFSVYPEFVFLEGKVTLVGGVGPYFGKILGSKIDGVMAETLEWPFSTDSIEGPITGSAEDYFLTRDVGLETVLGAEFLVTERIKILLESNMKLGLVSFSNSSLVYGYLKPYNFYIQLGVGYYLPDKTLKDFVNNIFIKKED